MQIEKWTRYCDTVCVFFNTNNIGNWIDWIILRHMNGTLSDIWPAPVSPRPMYIYGSVAPLDQKNIHLQVNCAYANYLVTSAVLKQLLFEPLVWCDRPTWWRITHRAIQRSWQLSRSHQSSNPQQNELQLNSYTSSHCERLVDIETY